MACISHNLWSTCSVTLKHLRAAEPAPHLMGRHIASLATRMKPMATSSRLLGGLPADASQLFTSDVSAANAAAVPAASSASSCSTHNHHNGYIVKVPLSTCNTTLIVLQTLDTHTHTQPVE